MSLSKATIILLGAIVLSSVVASLFIHHRGQMKLHQTEGRLRQQAEEFAELTAEHRQLANQRTQAENTSAEDRTVELTRLRAEAEGLRNLTNATAKQATQKAQSAHERVRLKPKTTVRSPGSVHVVSDTDSDEYALQLTKMAAGERNHHTSNARTLTSAVRAYAREHQGEVPATFAEAAPSKSKSELASEDTSKERDLLPGASDFEIVYHGSLGELTNIPQQTVVLIRQRLAWPTPGGKWARIYTMADGRLYIVESDDNFQSWEAEHIVPPPTAVP